MLHLLKIEWLKIKNYKAFWVFGILYLVSIFIVNYLVWYIELRTRQQIPESGMILGESFAFPKVWQTVAYLSSWLLYFPGMIIIMLMVNEFNFKTHRQNIIDGWSRQQFIGVKIALVIVFSAVITLINIVTSLIFGSISESHFSMDGTAYIFYGFLQSLAYLFFALMLGVLFRRSGLAIIIFILYGIIFEWLVYALVTFNFRLKFASFLPLQASDILIPGPIGNTVLYPNTPSATALVIAVLAYITAYIFFARKKFLIDDL